MTRAARETASIVEQFCKANGQILLPIVEMIQSASQVVETVIHEIGLRTLETILVLSAEHFVIGQLHLARLRAMPADIPAGLARRSLAGHLRR